MVPDIEIWRCAALLIRLYGDTADIEAATRVDFHKAKDERDLEQVWVRIAKAIDELQRVRKGETQH
jgi:hypothetical protein